MNHYDTNPDVVLEQLRRQFDGQRPEVILADVLVRFKGRITFATSFGAEDQVLTDMAVKTDPSVSIFTIDTGRLPEETFEIMNRTMAHYGIQIDQYNPDHREVEAMVNTFGPNLFYDGIEHRKQCCRVRKVSVLRRVLPGHTAWICGLRKEQSVTRQGIEAVQWDEQFGLFKICPLAEWSEQQVWDYIREHQVPYHSLHDKGYPSIGCAPCTRAVEPGQDIRSGRWWWEEPEHKECGLHWATTAAH